MKQRCYNPKNPGYMFYGEKGITICAEWMGEGGLYKFINWALNNGYDEHLTIDRINSDGPYAPSNCRWITSEENSKRVHDRISTNREIAESLSINIFKKMD